MNFPGRRIFFLTFFTVWMMVLVLPQPAWPQDDDFDGMSKWENYAAQAWRDFQGGNIHEAFKKIKIAYDAAPSNERVKRMYDMITVEKDRLIKRYISMGDAFYSAKKYNEALEAYSFALEADPHSPLVLAKINRLNRQAVGFGNDFLKLINIRSNELSATPGVANQDAEISMDLAAASRMTSSKADLYSAREYMNKGQLRDALVLFKKILAGEPGNESVAKVVKTLEDRFALSDNLKKAESHYSAARFADAVPLYRTVEEKFGLSPGQAARLAECLANIGDLTAAVETLDKNCPEGIADPAVTMTRAIIASGRGEYAEAAKSFYNLWNIGYEADRNEGAFYRNFFKAYWIRLLVAFLLCLAGLVFWLLGGLVARDAASFPWTIVAQAAIRRESRDPKGAAALLEQAISICPQAVDPELYAVSANNLGVILLEEGRGKEAESRFLSASRAWSDFPEAKFNLGVSLMSNPETEKEAVDNFRVALALALRDGLPGGLQRVFPLGRPITGGTKPGMAVSELFILARETLKRGKLG